MARRHTSLLALCGAVAWLGACADTTSPSRHRPPNIVLVMTDDQGWAQLGMRGDPDLRTPHLDRLASESAEFRRFYASPVCAPTRASLMTGRHAYRTGVTDTWLGRALMAPDETTIAEVLGEAGYRTGLFGKWHLGDSHPMRPQDQGFQEVLVHRGGGIGQPSDPPGSDYTDPVLFHNGEPRRFEGYVTDVLFSEAMRFIDERGDAPFFAYIATNAPHAPYLVPDSYREPYAARGLPDRDARIYGMITNIDDNIGRLLASLDARGLRDDTIVVFMTDNGPTTERFTAGLRNRKGSTYEGGIRVPFFVRWPGHVAPRQVDTIAAHIDVLPTLLEAARVAPPGDVTIDGRSLLPLLRGDGGVGWPARTIHIQAHRGNTPQPLRNFAAITDRYKLVEGTGFAEPPADGAQPELYDITTDPGEQHDLAAALPDEVDRLRRGYTQWFADVSSTRGFDPLPIALGADAEPTVTLTRQDWRPIGADGWGAPHLGAWEVDVRTSGTYDVRVELPPLSAFASPARVDGGRLSLALGDVRISRELPPEMASIPLDGLQWPAGRATLDVRVTTPDGRDHGVWFVHVTRR
jgi:arylsulfatase A-like enzyme